ncbi:MAG TPA: glycosyltransferase family 39 protein [Pseudolabrys sp.]|nr:glycosyltransferase family 39 protein [Pseudolabrys sp.]
MRRQHILTLAIATAVILGTFFRFFALDKKAYWFDETFTSLRIAGFTDREVVEKYRGIDRVVPASELKEFQSTQSGRTIMDTVKGLAVEEPQNPPLYYVAAKLWADVAGSSVYSTRLLPAILSLLVLPLAYWLCLELFGSALVGWIAVSLMALSPFYVLLAQTARPQSFWTVTIIFTAAALLRAMRPGRHSFWLVYALGLAASFYTFVLSGLFLVGFGLYVIIQEGFRLTKNVVSFSVSTAAALLAFAPWLIILYQSRLNVLATTSWVDSKITLFELLQSWLVGFVRLFFDINNQSGDSFVQLLPFLAVLPLLLVLFGYSVYFLCRDSPRRVWTFVFCLIGASIVPLVLVDIWKGGGRMSAANRYFIPAYVGIQISLAYLLGTKLMKDAGTARQSVWQGIGVLIGLLGIVSCVISSRTVSWWNKDPEGMNLEIASIINRSEKALVISDGWMGHLFSLNVGLNDRVNLQIEPLCYVCSNFNVASVEPVIMDNSGEVFYFHPGWEPSPYKDLIKALALAGNLQPITRQHGRVVLWKLIRQK